MLLVRVIRRERVSRSFLLGFRSGEFSFGALKICLVGSFSVGALINGFSRGETSFRVWKRLASWLRSAVANFINCEVALSNKVFFLLGPLSAELEQVDFMSNVA